MRRSVPSTGRPENVRGSPRPSAVIWWHIVHDTPSSASSGSATTSARRGAGLPARTAVWCAIGVWQRRHSSCTAASLADSRSICARKYGSRKLFAIIVACHSPCGETSSPVAVRIALAPGATEWQTAQLCAGRNRSCTVCARAPVAAAPTSRSARVAARSVGVVFVTRGSVGATPRRASPGPIVRPVVTSPALLRRGHRASLRLRWQELRQVLRQHLAPGHPVVAPLLAPRVDAVRDALLPEHALDAPALVGVLELALAVRQQHEPPPQPVEVRPLGQQGHEVQRRTVLVVLRLL